MWWETFLQPRKKRKIKTTSGPTCHSPAQSFRPNLVRRLADLGPCGLDGGLVFVGQTHGSPGSLSLTLFLWIRMGRCCPVPPDFYLNAVGSAVTPTGTDAKLRTLMQIGPFLRPLISASVAGCQVERSVSGRQLTQTWWFGFEVHAVSSGWCLT